MQVRVVHRDLEIAPTIASGPERSDRDTSPGRGNKLSQKNPAVKLTGNSCRAK
jgi:hypothetical protein